MFQAVERRFRLAATLGVVWGLLVGGGSVAGIFKKFEDIVLDWGQTWYDSAPPRDEDLALIAIDQVSSERPWPWPRFEYALLMRALIDRVPQSVVFEVLFNDDDARTSAFDDAFMSYARRIPNRVFAGAVLRVKGFEQIPEYFTKVEVRGEWRVLPSFGSLLWPLDHLMKGAYAGARNILPVVDEPLRSIPLVFQVGSVVTPSLALQAAAVKLGADPSRTRVILGQHIELYSGEGDLLRMIPIDDAGCMRLRFYPRQERVLTVGYDDFLVMADQAERGVATALDLNMLRKRQVWVSCTDRSVSQPVLTVVGQRSPVEVQMQAVWMILNEDFTRFWHPIMVFLVFIGASIFSGRIFVEWGMGPGIAFLAVMGVMWVELNLLIYQWLNLAFPLVASGIFLTGLVVMGAAARLWQFEDEPSPKLLLEFSTVPARAIAQLPAPAQVRVERELSRDAAHGYRRE
jgi:adenylate cyclase